MRDCQEILAELDYSLKTDQNIPSSVIDFVTSTCLDRHKK